MTINIGLAEPAALSEGTRQGARPPERRHVIALVMLAAAARKAFDRRTLASVIVLGIGLAAIKGMAQERGVPGLDWYLQQARRRAKGHRSA